MSEPKSDPTEEKIVMLMQKLVDYIKFAWGSKDAPLHDLIREILLNRPEFADQDFLEFLLDEGDLDIREKRKQGIAEIIDAWGVWRLPNPDPSPTKEYLTSGMERAVLGALSIIEAAGKRQESS